MPMHSSFIKSPVTIKLMFVFFLAGKCFAQDTTMRLENRPETFKIKGAFIEMHTNSEKYFWGDSHESDYDFPYSQFYFRDITGSFSAEVTVVLTDLRNNNNEGLLLKLNQTNWIKLYVGKENNLFRLNTVYASDYFHADYNTIPVSVKNNRLWLRMICKYDILYLSYSTDNLVFQTVRILNLPEYYKTARLGLMGDSPMSGGFDALFENFSVKSIQ
jgi:regulation of enolase protein 1 (concanavalin A-like superfamily)